MESSRPAVPRRAAKPKVLLVDDHPDILKSASEVLASEFEVVEVATDGQQALDASLRVDPDVIVLDITMRGLDGFQTAQALARAGSRARVVFMSMHGEDEYVAKAFRSGARGYVLKMRLHEDLVSAMNHALAGQLFVPSLRSLSVVAGGRGAHAAQFYASDDAVVAGIGGLVDVALRRGDMVSVIGSGPVRAGLADHLQANGWSVGSSGDHGRFHAMDTEDALSSILRDGRPDADLIAGMVAQLDRLRRASAEGPQRLTLVGDMSVPLLLSGDAKAMLDLERLWDELTCTLPFLTVCYYPWKCFSDESRADLFPLVCAQHWAIAHVPDGGLRSLLS